MSPEALLISVDKTTHFVNGSCWPSFHCNHYTFPGSIIISVTFYCYRDPLAPGMNKAHMGNSLHGWIVDAEYISFLRQSLNNAISCVNYFTSWEVSWRPSGSWIIYLVNGICPGYKSSAPGSAWGEIYRKKVYFYLWTIVVPCGLFYA